MKRLNFNIEQTQYDWLSNKSEEQGISISEIIRRALEEYIQAGGLGETMAGWETETVDQGEDVEFEEEVVHRLAMLEGMVMNVFPERRRQEIYDYAMRYADAQMKGIYFPDELPDEPE